MTRAVLAFLTVLAVFAAVYCLYRLWLLGRPHPGQRAAHRGDRLTTLDLAEIPGTTEHAAAGFLAAPVETIPVKPVYGTPPWQLPQPREELLPLPEPGCDGHCLPSHHCETCHTAPPIVADITRPDLGAVLSDYDPHAGFKTALLAAVKTLDGRGAHRVYLLMGGDT